MLNKLNSQVLKELDETPSATPQANEGKDSSEGYDPHKDYTAAKAKVHTEDHWVLLSAWASALLVQQ
jgi:hypothetical protein